MASSLQAHDLESGTGEAGGRKETRLESGTGEAGGRKETMWISKQASSYSCCWKRLRS